MSTLKEKAESILVEKNEKIIPENLPNDVTAFGVQGSIQRPADGYGVEGNLRQFWYNPNANHIETQLSVAGVYSAIINNNNYVGVNIPGSSVAQAIGLTADKIKKDETILGITGTLEGDFNEYGNYINDNIGFRDLCSKHLWPNYNISPDAEIFGFIETIGGISIQDTGANGVKLYGVFSIEKIVDSSNNPTVYIILVDDTNKVLGYTSERLGPTTQAWDKVVINQSIIYKVDGTRVTLEELMTLCNVGLTLTKPSV